MRKLGVISLMAFSILSTNLAYAAPQTYSTEVENNISTGDIDISLDEYELDKYGDRVNYINNKKVLPGQEVDKIVTITNNAESSWIRAKVEYNTSDGIENMSDDMLLGISDDWKKCGNYFYYLHPVDNKSKIDLFTGVKVPSEWTEEYEDMGFSIGITAQAIQSINFEPDFNSDDPWFGVAIEKCIHTNHDIYKVDSKNGFSVIFENGSEGFIKVGDDFFSNFNAMMPGDVVQDSVEYGNNSIVREIHLYFYTDVPEQDADSMKLLNDLKLVIFNNGTEIYNGNLSGEALRDGIEIGDGIDKGARGTLTYKIEMPKELTNSSALQKAKVKWIFRTEYNSRPDTTPSGNGSGGGGGGTTPGNPSEPTRNIPDNDTPLNTGHDPIPENVDRATINDNDIPLINKIINSIIPSTGDTTDIVIYKSIALVTGLLMIGLLVLEKAKERERSAKHERSIQNHM